MFSPNQRAFAPDLAGRSPTPAPKRDIVWDRPVFRPPVLPNPRVIFDPLPFTTQRTGVAPRHAIGR